MENLEGPLAKNMQSRGSELGSVGLAETQLFFCLRISVLDTDRTAKYHQYHFGNYPQDVSYLREVCAILG